jgi:hypothetical protein
MNPLIEHLSFVSPLVRALVGLLPHMPPPLVLMPSDTSRLPPGCLYLPRAKCLLTAAAGPIGFALLAADTVAREMEADVLMVSLRAQDDPHPIRFDVIFCAQDRTEHCQDLLFWTVRRRAPAFVPQNNHHQAVVLGRSGLIPSDPMPFTNPVERMAGIACGSAELRRVVWGDEG